MKHAETQEKSSLPHDSALIGVKSFDKTKLHHTDTNEKVVLPDSSGNMFLDGYHGNIVTLTSASVSALYNIQLCFNKSDFIRL